MMTEEQVQNIVRQEILKMLGDYSHIPLEVQEAFIARGFLRGTTGSLNGVIKATNGTFSGISQLSGTKIYYVADSSGGSVNRKLTFSDGVLVSET